MGPTFRCHDMEEIIMLFTFDNTCLRESQRMPDCFRLRYYNHFDWFVGFYTFISGKKPKETNQISATRSILILN